MTTQRAEFIRKQAVVALELTKGFTPEQRATLDNSTSTAEEFAFYIQELVTSLAERDQTIKELMQENESLASYSHESNRLLRENSRLENSVKELRAALKTCIDALMYTSTTGDLWMWARSNGPVTERMLEIRKLIYP